MRKKTALLGVMAASMLAYTNPYKGLEDLRYVPTSRGVSKTPLTKKQKKARIKSKNARKARKR